VYDFERGSIRAWVGFFMALGIIISVFIPLVFLYIIWTLDIYALSRVPLVFGALLWGLFTFAASFSVQNALMRVGLLDFWQITLFNAPVLEQLLKATFLIWLASQMRLRSSIDGAVYGFAVGTGFAMAENLLYISGTPDRALGIALARVLSVSLMHAYTTAIIGTATGASLYMAQRAHAQRIALALLASIMLHAMFNRLVMTADGVPLISTAIAAGLGGTALVALSMQRSLVADMRFIGHELGTMMPLPANAKTLTRQQVAALVADTRGEHNPVRRALGSPVRRAARRAQLAAARPGAEPASPVRRIVGAAAGRYRPAPGRPARPDGAVRLCLAARRAVCGA